jgi:hypothetical protein
MRMRNKGSSVREKKEGELDRTLVSRSYMDNWWLKVNFILLSDELGLSSRGKKHLIYYPT